MYLRHLLDYDCTGRFEIIADNGEGDNFMRNDQRQFHVYDLEIVARKEGATPPDLASVAAVWEGMKQAGRTYPIRADDATMLVGDIEINQARDVLIILVRLSDKNAPNSVYSDPAAGQFEEHMKVGNQGGDLGCHVLVSLTPEKGLPNIYTCAIERIPGISADLVRRLLSKLLNYEYHSNPAFHQYPHPNGGLDRQGNPRVDRCCPHIELRGRPSDTFINDINNGRLSGVSLIKTETATPIGGAAYLVKETSELKLHVDHKKLPGNLFQGLLRAFRGSASDYPVAKVAYRTPGSNRTVTVELDAATGTPLSDLYIKLFEIHQIFPFLAQSASAIVPHLRNLAIPELLAQRNI